MKLASIELVQEISEHPNADSLEIAKVLGYQVIVGKGEFKVGSAVVFIQPDTRLPDEPWAEMFRKRSNRVKSIKLRGFWSFGLALSVFTVSTSQHSEQLKRWLMPINIGKDISSEIGVTKYEPPAPQDLSAAGYLPTGLPKTDEERFHNIEDLPFGEEVDITLKIDGQSATYACKKMNDGSWRTYICSRSLEIKQDSNNNFTRINQKYQILEKLLEYCQKYDVSLALRGEIYGQGIQAHQNNPHSKGPIDFACFSVFNMDKLEYENTQDDHYYLAVAGVLGIPVVDQIGKFTLSQKIISRYSEEIKELNGRLFEGVVIKHETGSFKIINLHYDEKK
jgi:RNA ligase (TIGR02306 family)